MATSTSPLGTASTDNSTFSMASLSPVYTVMEKQQIALNTKFSELAGKNANEVNSLDMLQMQQDVAQWDLMLQIQATVTKQVSESLHSVIQKTG